MIVQLNLTNGSVPGELIPRAFARALEAGHEHRHRGIRFVTPVERHTRKDTAILSRRHALNLAARKANPAHWSGKTRNWTPIETGALNPEREPEVTPVEGWVALEANGQDDETAWSNPLWVPREQPAPYTAAAEDSRTDRSCSLA